ncbi:flocculation protein FLO11-like isoform X2 [Stegodyphus dumicola]|uniref:flocculation protein FLO11-like isoform X2 n=1 Tax=Stegodyphus dumicola TaxID=202533 RepID=UPI0015B1ED98|nr:flocculation protein FLO11-like isoform X2 [Stegodyphus dumicola]
MYSQRFLCVSVIVLICLTSVRGQKDYKHDHLDPFERNGGRVFNNIVQGFDTETPSKDSDDIVGGYWARNYFRCPLPWGNFPDPDDCSRYYTCARNRASHQRCKRNMHFDVFRKTCLPRFVAICGSDKDKTTVTESPNWEITTPKDKVFICPDTFGSLPYADDCSKYYSCTFFIPSLKSCPKGELFDGVKKQCKPEGDVHCGNRPRPTSDTFDLTSPVIAPTTTTAVTATNNDGVSGTTPTVSGTVSVRDEVSESTTATYGTVTVGDKDESSRSTPATSGTATVSDKVEASESSIPATSASPVISTIVEKDKSTQSIVTGSNKITDGQWTYSEISVSQEATTASVSTTESSSIIPSITPEEKISPTTPRPTGPPDTDCDEDDLDCIITETGDVSKWFTCPEAIGYYPHPSSNKLFIFCLNWQPSAKKCAHGLLFFKELRTCAEPESLGEQ